MAKPAEPVNSQDERRICAAVDRPVCLCWLTNKGRQQRMLSPRMMMKGYMRHERTPFPLLGMRAADYIR